MGAWPQTRHAWLVSRSAIFAVFCRPGTPSSPLLPFLRELAAHGAGGLTQEGYRRPERHRPRHQEPAEQSMEGISATVHRSSTQVNPAGSWGRPAASLLSTQCTTVSWPRRSRYFRPRSWIDGHRDTEHEARNTKYGMPDSGNEPGVQSSCLRS